MKAATRTILAAGLACGTMDLTAALVVYGHFGLRPMRLLQGIAAGLLGTDAFTGGGETAALGVFCHYLIALLAATTFFIASRKMPLLLLRHAIVAGILYGIAVYFFMNRIVVPMSRAVKYPFSVRGMVIGIVIHIFCVGLPIALVTRYTSPE